MIVLAEEHHRSAPGGREAECLGDIALAGGAVAEICEYRDLGTLQVSGIGITGGVQSLGADDNGRIGHIDLVRIPAGVRHTAPQPGEQRGVHAAAVGHPRLAVAAEHIIVAVQGAGRADLRGFLAEQWWPQAELALALQCGRLDVDTPDDHQVLVQSAQLVRADIGDQRGMLAIEYPAPVGLDQLYRIRGRPGVVPGCGVLHSLHLLVVARAGSPHFAIRWTGVPPAVCCTSQHPRLSEMRKWRHSNCAECSI